MKKRILSLILALMTMVSLCVPMAGAESGVDLPVIETSGAATLSTPKLTAVTSEPNGVKLTWGAVSGAAKYRVFYKGDTGWKKIADTTSTSYTWTGAANGTKYTFTVRCVSADGSTFTSAYDTTGKTITYTKTLATPKISSVSGEAGKVVIKWGAVSGAAKYRVFYKGDTGWKKIADTTSTSYTWAAAAAGTKYTFTVRCVSSDGSAFTSNYDTTGTSYTVPSGTLATPKISSVTGEAGKVVIKWGAVSGAAKYRVFYKGDSGWKKIADTASTSYTWAAAAAGTKYTFTVRCVSADGSAFTSNYDTAGTSYTVPSGTLATPKISSVSGEAGKVVIKWGAVSGAAKYRVFYKGDTGWKKIADTASTSYTWAAAAAGTKYTFTVRCVSSDGSAFTSNYDTAGTSYTVPSDMLDTPKLSSVSNVIEGVKLSWGAVSGAAKYRVFYKNGTSWKKIADTTSTSYTWTGAESGTAYTFTVRCVSADGKTFTSSYDKTGKSITYLAAPVISDLSSTDEGVEIAWGKVSGAAKYRVFYRNGTSWKKIVDTADTSYVWTAAEDGETYAFTVRCVSADGKTFTSSYDTAGKSITFEAPKTEKFPSASEIKATFARLKQKYPDFTPWSNEANVYEFEIIWNGQLSHLTQRGCAAFAWLCSNEIFGDVPAYTHHSFDKIKVGDIIRCYGNSHSVIVTEKKANSVVVAQGNVTFTYPDGTKEPPCVWWGDEIERSVFEEDPLFAVYTRYPQ